MKNFNVKKGSHLSEENRTLDPFKLIADDIIHPIIISLTKVGFGVAAVADFDHKFTGVSLLARFRRGHTPSAMWST